MRNAFVVCYDIACDKRRTQVSEICKGYGDRVQYSVFRCHLSNVERLELEERLRAEIHWFEDQVLFVDLGPSDGRGGKCIEAIGLPYKEPEDGAVIL